MQKPPTQPMRALERPMFLNLLQIQMPVGAVTSILHRLSGVVMALGVPLVMYLFWRSLGSQEGFAQVMALLHQHIFQAVVLVLVWALAHHVLAGVRHMLTDFNIGSTLHYARRSAWGVNVAAAALALLTLVVLP